MRAICSYCISNIVDIVLVFYFQTYEEVFFSFFLRYYNTQLITVFLYIKISYLKMITDSH